MDGLKATFAQCKREKRSALVTYVTAGYPTAEETPDIMLGMEAGGAGRKTLLKASFGGADLFTSKTSLSLVCRSQTLSQMVPRYKSQIRKH